MESKVQLAIEFHYHILQIATAGYLNYKLFRTYNYYYYEKVHFWHLIPVYQPNQWTDGPGQHNRMINPSFEVYNPLISYIRQASRKFPKWGLRLCCFPVISNHPRFSVMPFQMYLWVERNHHNFWHILLLRNNPVLSVPSDFSVDDIYFLFLFLSAATL